jgi:hypothetical protein
MACTKFPDSIAAGNYDIDIHNPEGGGTSHYYFPKGAYYTIPYRCLQPAGADNLLVAGRCVSATHEAQASMLGTLVGRAALVVPFIVPIPIIVPAYPARRRATRVGRAALAAATAFIAGVTLLELPRGFGAVGSYQSYAQDRLSERPAGDFAIGVKLLPTLAGLPPAPAVRDAAPLSKSSPAKCRIDEDSSEQHTSCPADAMHGEHIKGIIDAEPLLHQNHHAVADCAADKPNDKGADRADEA